jgi:hypothetical protein
LKRENLNLWVEWKERNGGNQLKSKMSFNKNHKDNVMNSIEKQLSGALEAAKNT